VVATKKISTTTSFRRMTKTRAARDACINWKGKGESQP
jgi:hypothetical protein